jgi:hypothetical protein
MAAQPVQLTVDIRTRCGVTYSAGRFESCPLQLMSIPIAYKVASSGRSIAAARFLGRLVCG